jgi:Ras-related protein Rab-8A
MAGAGGKSMGAYDYLIKLMLIGDSGVGKSSLLLRFSDDSFDMNCTPTIGIDFKLRTIELDGKKIKLQLLDTAGQERFKTITTAHYRNAMGILLVYDVTNEQSFKNIEDWLKNIDKHTSQPVNKILIGNKMDLAAQRKISTDEGRKLAERLNMAFYETSAKDKSCVDEAFFALTRDIKKRLGEHGGTGGGGGRPQGTVQVGQDTSAASTKKGGCC